MAKDERSMMSGMLVSQQYIAAHAIDEMHAINWKEVQVVERPSTLQAWHIRSERNNINRVVDPLPSTYI